MTEDRVECLHCAEMIQSGARVCAHCQGSALVDVCLESPVGDGRVAYRLARSIAGLGLGPSFRDLQDELKGANPRLAAGLTRAQAAQVVALAEQAGQRPVLEVDAVAERPQRRAASGLARKVGLAAVLVGLAGIAFLALRSRSGLGLPSGWAGGSTTTRDLARAGLESVASLWCSDSVGSGFYVDADLLLTNAHVLCSEGDTLQVRLADGRSAPGEILDSDPDLDLALVRTELHAPALPLGDADTVEPGDPVLIIGSPMGLEFTVHEGMVSSTSRAQYGVSYLQLDAEINPGNSGGPVLDRSGRVVGIVTLKLQEAEGIGFALPINYAYTGPHPMLDGPAGAGARASTGSHAARADTRLAAVLGRPEVRSRWGRSMPRCSGVPQG